jgi:hypothetical protein
MPTRLRLPPKGGGKVVTQRHLATEGSASSPAAGDLVLLPDAGFVLT